MDPDTLLLRQVHPAFVQSERITSQVFYPTEKDNNRLSTYSSEKFSAPDAFNHYTSELKLEAAGVVAVSCDECDTEELPYVEDNDPFDGHCYIDYNGLSNNKKKTKSKILKRRAEDRGWLYQTSS